MTVSWYSTNLSPGSSCVMWEMAKDLPLGVETFYIDVKQSYGPHQYRGLAGNNSTQWLIMKKLP